MKKNIMTLAINDFVKEDNVASQKKSKSLELQVPNTVISTVGEIDQFTSISIENLDAHNSEYLGPTYAELYKPNSGAAPSSYKL